MPRLYPELPNDSGGTARTAVAETQARRARAEAELRTAARDTGTRMTRDAITRLARSISDLAAVIRRANPDEKAEFVPASNAQRNNKSPRSR